MEVFMCHTHTILAFPRNLNTQIRYKALSIYIHLLSLQ